MALKRGCKGFTLIELLLAATMLAILVISVSGHLRAGVEVWKRQDRSAESLQRRRAALTQLDQDLAHALIIDSRQEAYGIEAGKLPAPLFGSSQMEWYSAHLPSEQKPLGSAVFVRYWCGVDGEKSGLWRQVIPLALARARTIVEPVLLLPGCESMTVRYAVLAGSESSVLEWRTSWTSGVDRLPGLVEVRLEIADSEEVVQVFALPSGTLSDSQPAAGT